MDAVKTKRFLPNLNALRAFEAAARQLNFRLAAAELNISHSAISHHIHNLEQQLEVHLFRRVGRNVVLTEAGNYYLPILTEAFDRIADGTRLLRSLERPHTLVVQVYITVAMLWLLPRMHDFLRSTPEIEIQLSTTYLDWEFNRGAVDVGIIWTDEKDRNLSYFHLAPAMLYPMCSPELLQQLGPAPDLADLKQFNILQLYNRQPVWDIWLQQTGVESWSHGPAIKYDSYLLALEAARKGRGIALANSPFAVPDLEDEKLVRPFRKMDFQVGDWYLVCEPELAGSPKVKLFQQWLLQQLAADDTA